LLDDRRGRFWRDGDRPACRSSRAIAFERQVLKASAGPISASVRRRL
jgi:hypothetical protein